ncbi:MAG: hypothetical protein GWO16_02665 [Gammaproteobacteria bacterium]|nr:hypothetical protein [Gammaproteobacteria bacterium]NIR28569.1 hypothetical protein [Gammaproteobacteria bacterium]NIR97039.1 hypothetical protein [Gammaproteobacteria bacterium]NIT62737.1 hypothetical protein [Gammaproteobacteria bacterium]NIV19695.1 hypothetical protein [Gammaproteobacteria bacterium]
MQALRKPVTRIEAGQQSSTSRLATTGPTGIITGIAIGLRHDTPGIDTTNPGAIAPMAIAAM